MCKRRECYLMVGPLPPENREWVTGVQMAFAIFVNSLENDNNKYFKVINSARGVQNQSIGRISFLRILGVIETVLQTLFYSLICKNFYLIISSSWGGFLKDSLMIWQAAIMQKRIVIHLNGGGYHDFYNNLSDRKRKFVKCTLDQVDHVIVLGKALQDQFYFLDDQTKITIIPNGVPALIDPDAFEPKKLSQDGEPIELLFLSNLIVSKGYWDVLEACNILHNELGIPILCHFAGGFAQINTKSDHELYNSVQEARSNFFTKINEYKLNNIVKYHGVVKGDQKKELLFRSHLFILPTYYEWEGQPLSILEAMACGTPIITTAHKAIPDVIKPCVNGIFIPPKSPKKIAETVLWFYKHPQKYNFYSEQAYRRFLEEYNEQAYAQRLSQVVIVNPSKT